MRCIIVENVHEFIIPGFYDISCILQVRQMVLRKILQLYNATCINAKEIRATKGKKYGIVRNIITRKIRFGP